METKISTRCYKREQKMKLTSLVVDPSKLKTHGKFILPEEAYKQLAAGNKDPRLIKIVASDPTWAYHYALEVIKGRFPEGEPAIAKSPAYAYYYADDILKGRFPEGESTIAKSPMWAYQYALNIIKNRFFEGEPAVAEDPTWTYRYARDVIRGR